MIYALGDQTPDIHPDTWVAPGAHVLGRVALGEGVGIWFGAVLRGDNEWIRIGAGSNVQENSVLHTDMGYPMVIGRDVTIGHKAILHGCTVEDGALIGMGATVMNGAVIGAGAVVGAGALIPEGKVIPPGSLVMGAPGKVVREVPPELRAKILEGARRYVENMRRHRETLRPLA